LEYLHSGTLRCRLGSGTDHPITKNGDEEDLRQILKSGVDKKSNTALHHATKYAHLPVMRFLIDHGADLNALNDRESIPLHLTEKISMLSVFCWRPVQIPISGIRIGIIPVILYFTVQ